MEFKKLFDLAKKEGIEDIQVVINNGDSLQIEVFNQTVSSLQISRQSSLSAKGIYQGKMGYYATEVVSESEFPLIVEKIKENAGIITSVDEVFIYAGDEHYEKIEGQFNKELKNTDIKEKINLTLAIEKNIKEKGNVGYSEADYNEENNKMIMVNSKGLELKDEGNLAEAVGVAVIRKDNDSRTGFEVVMTNDFKKLDAKKLSDEAYYKGASLIGAKPVESKQYKAILNEEATATLVHTFSSMFSSEMVQKNLSILKGKVGQVIGSPVLTIVDDPFLKESFSSTSFDSEGVATKYKELVKNGVLNGFIYNLKTAKKEGVKSTGNGFGSGCAPINLYIKPGEKTKEELIAGLDEGILITSLQGSHAGANPLSGDFSLQATGFLIKDGKKTQPVALITVSSNILNIFQDVVAVSSELKNGYNSPAIEVKKVSVSGL